jgi:hypothetical protein
MILFKVFRGKEMTSSVVLCVLLKQKSFITIGRFGVGPLLKRDNFLFECVDGGTPQILFELFRSTVETAENASAQCTVYESYQIIKIKTQLRLHNAAAAA